ncbi:MAG: HRDC domain-containing protein [Victivallales bacterium]|nr:HRDC domain-containing protein [Victivallales bacterium]
MVVKQHLEADVQIRVFSIPAVSEGLDDECEMLNAFLRGHRILSVKRELTVRDGVSYWSCCVEYLENGVDSDGSGGGRHGTFGRKERIDYRAVLDAETFARFIQLRECRRIVAEENHVPCYALWNDEVQAELAKFPELTKSSMLSVKGLGKGTFEKYGDRFLILWREKTNETGGQSVHGDSGDGQSATGVLESAAGEEGETGSDGIS